MKVEKEILPNSRIRLTIEISPQTFQRFYDEAFLKLSKDSSIPGFRPGKAPRHMAESQIGPDKIFSEALEAAIPQTYFWAVEESKIVPIEQPKIKIIEFDAKKPIKYEAQVDILPQVKLGNYRRIRAGLRFKKITEKEVELALKNLQKSKAEYKKVSRATKRGDRVEIDFEGYLDNVKLEQLTSKNHPIVLGETKLIPGFEEKIIGMKAGNKKEFDLILPKQIPDQLIAGKKVRFKVEAKLVEEVMLPKIDDKWAAKISRFKTLLELTKDIKKTLENQAKVLAQQELEREVVEKLTNASSVEIPESLVKIEQERMLNDFIWRVESQGLKFDDYLRNIKKTREEILEGLKNEAERAVKIGLVISAFKEKEGIKVEDSEVEAEIEKYQKLGQKIDKNDEGARKYVRNILGNRKAVRKLVGFATK